MSKDTKLPVSSRVVCGHTLRLTLCKKEQRDMTEQSLPLKEQ